MYKKADFSESVSQILPEIEGNWVQVPLYRIGVFLFALKNRQRKSPGIVEIPGLFGAVPFRGCTT